MVSFIILNYNTTQLALNCVDSIFQHVSGITYEIVVVDNSSHKEELEELEKVIKERCKIIKLKWNTGFGLGNMAGANVAEGNYLCFINSDVMLCEDCISPLVSYLEKNPHVGCVTPQQYNGKGQQARSFKHNTGIRHKILGDRFFEKFFPEKYPNRRIEHYGEPYTVPQLNGSFMLFPADKFWKIGGFDTNIFLYHEEYDVGLRLAKEGWTCVVLPSYKFIHLGSAAISKQKKMSYIEHRISQMYVYRKHHSLFLASIFKWICIAGVLFSPSKWYLLRYLIRGEAMSLSMRHKVSGNI